MKQELAEEPDGGRRVLCALRTAWDIELTPKQRLYMHCYYVRAMTMQQIAEEYGVNPGTVSRTLRRAKERLQRVLQYYLRNA